MRWPTPQDFNEAVQSPVLCFSDPELARGEVSINPIGLPQSISGNFASVYKVTNNGTRYAVRCFLTNRLDTVDRYRIIGDFLRNHPLSCSVPFQFLEKGIRVGGEWFPVLKMPWIEGESLELHVQNNLLNQKKLTALADQFFDVVDELESWQVAHGDLQHGNIIVSGNGLKLIDYDGFFVPGLLGYESLEIGHPNYQHPLRTEKFFDDTVDNFSCWLIYVSLRCLAIDPSLFHLLEHGEECLIFTRKDLVTPQDSTIFKAVLEHDSLEIRCLGTALSRLLQCAPQTVPPLQVPDDGWTIESTMVLTACVELPKARTESDVEYAADRGKGLSELNSEEDEYPPFDDLPLATKTYQHSWGTSLTKSAFIYSSKVVRRTREKIFDVIDRGSSKLMFPLWAWSLVTQAEKLMDNGDYVAAAEVYRRLHNLWSKDDEHLNRLLHVLVKLCICYERTNQPGMASNFYRLASQIQTPKGKSRSNDFITQKTMFFSFLASRRAEDRASALSILTEIVAFHEQAYKKDRPKDLVFPGQQESELTDMLDFVHRALELVTVTPSAAVKAHTDAVLRVASKCREKQLVGSDQLNLRRDAIERLLTHAVETQEKTEVRDPGVILSIVFLQILCGCRLKAATTAEAMLVDRATFERVLDDFSQQVGWEHGVEAASLLLSTACPNDRERLAPALWRAVIRKLYAKNLIPSLLWLKSHPDLIEVCLDDRAIKGIILSIIHAFPKNLDSIGAMLDICANLGEKGDAITEAVLNNFAEKLLEDDISYGHSEYSQVRDWMAIYNAPVARWDEFYEKYSEVESSPYTMR
ncbi:MAG: hypothetical protein K2X93_27765 [Candidatus Obscuribacterales bacterium]|nr:hypothetical protein [Candidatus Obscuribacterales bacterium]